MKRKAGQAFTDNPYLKDVLTSAGIQEAMFMSGATNVIGATAAVADLFGGDGETTGFTTGELPMNLALGAVPIASTFAGMGIGYALPTGVKPVDARTEINKAKQDIHQRVNEVGREQAQAEFAQAKEAAYDQAKRVPQMKEARRTRNGIYAGLAGQLLGTLGAVNMMRDAPKD